MQRTTYSLGSRGKERPRGARPPRRAGDRGGRRARARSCASSSSRGASSRRRARCSRGGSSTASSAAAPEDDIEDPEIWRAFFKAVDEIVWRHQAFPGRVIGAHRVLVDAGYRPDVVRYQMTERYAHEVRQAGMDLVPPFGARILPSRGKSQETGNHLIDLSDGTKQRTHGKRPQFPALVWLHTIHDQGRDLRGAAARPAAARGIAASDHVAGRSGRERAIPRPISGSSPTRCATCTARRRGRS